MLKCFFFFRARAEKGIARAEKGIARHIDASSVVWTLSDNVKLANQIARLVAIVVKNTVEYTRYNGFSCIDWLDLLWHGIINNYFTSACWI